MKSILFLSASLAVVDAAPQDDWQTEIVWGCQFTEKGREPFVMAGIVSGKPKTNPNAERPHAVLVTKDESNRYLNKGARGLYHRVPEPGLHWVFFDAGKGDSLGVEMSPPVFPSEGWLPL